MPRYFCFDCGSTTTHLNVKEAAEHAQVSRTTLYAWLKKRLVHGVVRPSGRRFICSGSLLRPDVSESLECAERWVASTEKTAADA